MRALAGWLLWLCAALLPVTATATVQTLDRAQAAPSGWDAPAPPTTGWVPVQLIDTWTERWPNHDGVVWYRLRWTQDGPVAPTGLLLPYVCLASEVWLNGALIQRDPQLVEPLSRAWTRPRYFLLDAPLLRQGENELLVRVSGLSAYQPGLGTVTVGDPPTVSAMYRRAQFLRHDVQLFDHAVGGVLGLLFAMLWLLRRRDTVYGWFALSAIFSALYGWNYVAQSPWPFSTTDRWAAFNIAAYLCGGVCMTHFLLRHCERRWPRIEAALKLLALASLLLTAFAPQYLGPHRDPWAAAGTLLYYAAMLWFVVYALRRGRPEQRVLAACLSLQMVVSLHDALLFFELIRSDTYLLSLTAPLTLLGIGFVLMFRYAQALKRTEGFNAELRREVAQATEALGQTLQREHALALDNTRIGERLNLVRDLHDGFGGTLLGTIASLEQADASHDPQQLAATLKDMREDLRLVIATTTQAQDTDLMGLLAPLRHRWNLRFEAVDIDSRWQLDALEGLQPGASPSLDLLRLLQEALTNVYKHSRATRVDITATRHARGIALEVRDDGAGFDPTRTSFDGAGLASLHARALRLGSPLQLHSTPGTGTSLQFELILDPTKRPEPGSALAP